MEPFVTVTFNNLSPAQARNLFASLRCDYQGPQPLTVGQVAGGAATTISPPAETVADRAINPPLVVDPDKERALVDTAMEALRTGDPDTAGLGAAKKKRGRSRKEKPADATPPSGDLQSAELEPSNQPTLNDARTAMAELSSKKGLDECRKLLTKFGANRIGELDVAKYAEFIKACAA